MYSRFDIACILSGESEAVGKFLCSLSCFMPERPIELLKLLLPYSLLEGIGNCNVCAGQSFRCDLPSDSLGNRVYFVRHLTFSFLDQVLKLDSSRPARRVSE